VIAIGVTGGIGSGKTTVAERLQALGAAVVDTDEISRALTAPGGGAVDALREAFGARFIAPDGALDRNAMREAVFEDPAARERLESILHPAIRDESDRALAAANGPYALLVVPLLFETGAYRRRLERILVVDCPEETQVARTMARSGLTAGAVKAIMAAQWPRWRRLQAADDVVWNGGEPGALDSQVERLHERYRNLSGNC
jgi:dephospho-CoA kinase